MECIVNPIGVPEKWEERWAKYASAPVIETLTARLLVTILYGSYRTVNFMSALIVHVLYVLLLPGYQSS